MKRSYWLGLAVVLILFNLQVVGLRYVFVQTSLYTTADFLPRWFGAHELVVNGRDPYSDAVTADIEAVMDPNQERTNSFNFAFPLHVIFTFLPLAFLPQSQYALIQAFWMTSLQWITLTLILVLFLWQKWRPSPLALAGVVLAIILFYPVVRTILLGQFTLHVALFLAATVWCLARGHDMWAGLLLAGTTIKPQMVVLILPWMVLWGYSRRNWPFLRGIVIGGSSLLITTLFMLPSWPIGFFRGLFDYAEVASGKPPLVVLADLLNLPAGAATLLVLPLLGGMIWAWWRGWGQTGPAADRALYWTIVVSLLAPFQTGTTNHVLLLIPLFAWLAWGKEHRPGLTIIVTAVLSMSLWWLFMATRSGDYENPLLFLPLPLFCLVTLLVREWKAPVTAVTHV